MLQTELARYMAMCGKPNLAAVERGMVKIHAKSGSGGHGSRVPGFQGTDLSRRSLPRQSESEGWMLAKAGHPEDGGVSGSVAACRPDSARATDPRPLFGQRRVPGLEEMATAFDFEPVMFANVPLATYNYTAHGSGSEFTLRRNREAFDWVEDGAGTSRSIRRR